MQTMHFQLCKATDPVLHIALMTALENTNKVTIELVRN